MTDAVTEDELRKVLRYVDSILQHHAFELFNSSGGDLDAIDDFLSHLHQLGRESQLVENSRTFAMTDRYRDLTVGDIHLRQRLSEISADLGSSFMVGAWASRDFAHKCERLLDKLRTFRGSIVSPVDEMREMDEQNDVASALRALRRNLERHHGKGPEDRKFRYGVYLSLRTMMTAIADRDMVDVMATFDELHGEFAPTLRPGSVALPTVGYGGPATTQHPRDSITARRIDNTALVDFVPDQYPRPRCEQE